MERKTAETDDASTPDRVRDRYPRGFALLHWAMALLIIAQAPTGIIAHDLPKGDPMRASLFTWHFSMGVAVFLLVLVRLSWRMRFTAPVHRTALKAWETRLARFNYVMLYTLMLVMPITGYLSLVSPTGSFLVFGFIELPSSGVSADSWLYFIAERTHRILFFVLLGLIVLHIAGTLKHLIFDKSNLLTRMWPL